MIASRQRRQARRYDLLHDPPARPTRLVAARLTPGKTPALGEACYAFVLRSFAISSGASPTKIQKQAREENSIRHSAGDRRIGRPACPLDVLCRAAELSRRWFTFSHAARRPRR